MDVMYREPESTRVQVSPRVGGGRACDPGTEGVRTEYLVKAFPEGENVTKREQEPGPLVLNLLQDPSGGGGDDSAASAHCLCDDASEWYWLRAGVNHDVQRCVDSRDVPLKRDDSHPPFKAERE